MVSFVGGPFDGLFTSLDAVGRCAASAVVGGREFALLPPPAYWAPIYRGDRVLADLPEDEKVVIYERVLVPGGAEFRYREGVLLDESLQVEE